MNWLNKINNPLLFQGNSRKNNYFEGWYYKQVAEDMKTIVSIIPGISIFNGDTHSFVQYIYTTMEPDGRNQIKSGYIRYALQDFKYNDNSLELHVGSNVFKNTEISLKLSDHGFELEGSISFGAFTEINRNVWMPSIMGYFSYIPRMECYHGVGSMMHSLSGCLQINNREIDFRNGKGYIEKDWGVSFPHKYIWIQCNYFDNESTSLFCSIADIPFMGSSFMGFISNLVIDGQEYRFATYNKSKLNLETIDNQNISIILENKNYKITIKARIPESGHLTAPKLGKMERIIKEGLSGEVWFELIDKQMTTIARDHGYVAGIEIVGF